jgi:hypothetical protein
LQDAHYAGTSRSSECTLVLTEGDSAMALAVAGLEVVGREVRAIETPARMVTASVLSLPVPLQAMTWHGMA